MRRCRRHHRVSISPRQSHACRHRFRDAACASAGATNSENVTTAETGLAPTPQAHDYASGDFREAFRAGAAHAVAAFSEKGVMDRAMRLPFADLPGGVYVSIAALDTFVHGWDLAKATGQSTDLDPGVAESLLAFARAAVPDTARGPDGIAAFGPPVELAEVSCPADELAAFMGRRP